jgi:hypothetical protein
LSPSEPDILDSPADVVAEIAVLRTAVEQVVPVRRSDSKLIVDIWNVPLKARAR